jgi:hypothetical protein
MGELFRSDYYVVEWRQGEPFLRVTRTAKPFARIADTEQANDELGTALRDARARRVLVDLREGPPGRNDEAFEQVSARWRQLLGQLFERRTVLVKSAAGKLQILRMTRGVDNLLVTQDAEEAARFLR